ncbi:MAG: 50S ribosomal protein L22 [Pseudomonadota bacterium]
MNEQHASGVARGRFLPVSAQKVRLVLAQIRGCSIEQAINTLTFSPQKAGRLVLKVLESAIANAEHNEGVDLDELRIVRAMADEGPTRKRVRPRAKYRADPVQKRTCHVTIEVGVGR